MRYISVLIAPDAHFFSMGELPGSCVLNYGCGNRKAPWHIGVDVSPESAADHVVPSGHPLPFLDNHFDVVISRYVLEHVPDLPTVMQEIARVLKPGGIFRFCVPHVLSLNAFDDPTHCTFFTLRTIDYFTGHSDIHYSAPIFSFHRQYLRLTLAWPRWWVIRYPLNLLLGALGLAFPNLGEQLLKLPFLSGTLYVELMKAP